MLEHADTREAGVSVILSLLDPTKNYYTGGKDAYLRTPNAGLMKIMDQCLLNMLRQGRFNVFLTAFMNPTASAAAASSAVPAGSTHVAAAAELKESAPAENTEGHNPAVSMWRGAAQMATFYNVLRAVALKVGYTPSTFSIDYPQPVIVANTTAITAVARPDEKASTDVRLSGALVSADIYALAAAS